MENRSLIKSSDTKLSHVLSKIAPTAHDMVSETVKSSLKTFKSGANDVIVVEQYRNGVYKTTPLHIRYR